MTIEESLESQFKSFSLPPVRHSANLAHLYADYVELLAILHNSDWFTDADLVQRFKTYSISVPDVSTRVAGPQVYDNLSPAEIEDAYDSWAQQVFSQLLERSGLFDSDYPFELQDGAIRLRQTLGDRHKIYIMLVLCSNLPYISKLQASLTSDFEQLAYEAMKSYLPVNAVVRQLGKNSDYKGDAQKKIFALAVEMHLDVNKHEFNKILGTQERGLDVVGWVPFRDGYGNLLTLFAQCACGKEWYSKLSETRRFDNSYFVFEKLRPIHAIFVPRGLCYNGDLYQSDEISDVLLFERSRILENIKGEEFFAKLESKQIVDYIIAFEEELV